MFTLAPKGLAELVLNSVDFGAIETKTAKNGREYMTTRQQQISLDGVILPDGRRAGKLSQISICANIWPEDPNAVAPSKTYKTISKRAADLTPEEKRALAAQWLAE